MRSRRLAIDGDPWLYHAIFGATQLAGDVPTSNYGNSDYILLTVYGGGDDSAYSNGSPIAPEYLTIWTAGLVSTDAPTLLQQIFMGLDPLNADFNPFPGSYYDLGRFTPGDVDVTVGAIYRLINGRPSEFFSVEFTSLEQPFSVLASLTISNGVTSVNQASGFRPADGLLTNLSDNPDTLPASAEPQTVHGLGGADTLYTGIQQTDLHGDDGNDTLIDNFGSSNLYGGADNDQIYAGPNDYIDGGSGNDTIYAVTQTAADLVANGYTGIRGYFDGGTGSDKAVFDFTAASLAIGFALQDNSDPHVGSFLSTGGTLALLGIEATEILGGSGNDQLTGASTSDLLLGNAGADTLDGGDGNDTLDAGIGGLAPGAFDTLIGGTGDDTYIVRNGAVVITEFAGQGTDTVRSDASFILPDTIENLTLVALAALNGTGNTLGNLIIGNNAANVINGLGGADRLNGGQGADTMSGGAGDDIFYVDNGADKTIEVSGEGTDTVYSTASFNIAGTAIEILLLTGTAAINGFGNFLDNAINGNDGANTLAGYGGADRLNGGLGADTLIGGTGDDIYTVDNAGDKVTELTGEGTDTIFSSATFALTGTFVETLRLTGAAAINATGNGEANTLIGNDGVNILTGLGGADVFNGGKGIDTMIGGTGDDTYVVDNTGEIVTELAGEGTDTVFSPVTFSLVGTAVEVLRMSGTAAINGTGNELANTIVGNDGANVLDGLGGADILIGGGGDDTFTVNNAGDKAVERQGGGTDTINSSVSFSLSETYVETLRLTGAAAINATGNSQINTLLGNGAANTLTGLGGNDMLDGGQGADTLIGGTGDDSYVVDNSADTVTELSGEGNDSITSLVTFTLAGTAVETLALSGGAAINATGNDDANTLGGNGAANTLTGLGGNDTLIGGAGADILIGGLGDDLYIVADSTDKVTEITGQGTDTVQSSATFNIGGTAVETLMLTGTAAINGFGSSIANTMLGNAGANTLSGFGGADVLDGGLGADTLTGGDAADTFRFSVAPDPGNIDKITDFVSGTDKIALSAAAFNEMPLGALAGAAFHLGTAAHDGDDRVIYDALSGKLWFDEDGDGSAAAVVFATVAPATAVAAADFLVI